MPSQRQLTMQRLARRLRAVLDFELTGLEGEMQTKGPEYGIPADTLEKLTHSAYLIAQLEYLSSTMDARIERDKRSF